VFTHSHIQELVPMEIVNLMQAVSYKLLRNSDVYRSKIIKPSSMNLFFPRI